MCSDLSQLSREKLETFLDSFDNVFLDCDGVIFILTQLLEGISETISTLQTLGKSVKYITNNTSRARQHHASDLNKYDIKCCKDDFCNPTGAIADYLKKINFNKNIYMISLPGMRQELKEEGFNISNEYKPEIEEVDFKKILKNFSNLDKDVGAVVFCLDFNMTYIAINRVINYLKNPDVLFITTGTDRKIIYAPDKYVIGPAYFQDIVKDVTKRESIALGKPEKHFAEYLINHTKCDPKRTLFVGDSLEQDIAFAKRLGMQTLLVLTGVTKLEDIKICKDEYKPDYYIQSLGDLHGIIEKNNIIKNGN